MELEALSGKISVLEALNGVEMRALERNPSRGCSHKFYSDI